MNIWQSGLYDCCNDCNICCYGCWCASCLYAENAVQIDGTEYDDACTTYLLSGRNIGAVIPLTQNRRALREKYGLPEEPCGDCTVMSCCAPCAVCQTARELKYWNNIPGPIPNMPVMFQPTNNIVYMQPVVSTEPISFIQPQSS